MHVFKFVNFSPFYVLVCGRIWLLRTSNSRLALAKFMAMSLYTYLVLKMPTEQGILSLRTNLDITYACEKGSFVLTEATDISICM